MVFFNFFVQAAHISCYKLLKEFNIINSIRFNSKMSPILTSPSINHSPYDFTIKKYHCFLTLAATIRIVLLFGLCGNCKESLYNFRIECSNESIKGTATHKVVSPC